MKRHSNSKANKGMNTAARAVHLAPQPTVAEGCSANGWEDAYAEWSRIAELVLPCLHITVRPLVEQSRVQAWLRGAISAMSLFPRTQYEKWVGPFELSPEESLRRDWYMVGGDLYQAMLKQGVIEQLRAKSTTQPECADSACTR